MPGFIFYILIILMIYMFVSNYKLAKRNKQNKVYVEAAGKLFKGDKSALDDLNIYLENSKDVEFKTKAQILKIYACLLNNIDYQETLTKLDISFLLGKNKKYDSKVVNLNVDSFIWLILVFNKAKNLNKEDLIKELMLKFQDYDSNLTQHLEYNLLKNIKYNLLDEEDKGLFFFQQLLTGEYGGYYSKRLIGLYKRIATFYALKSGFQIESDFNNMQVFAKTSVGELLLKDSNTYTAFVDEEFKDKELEK